jgi:hypothetical protein
MSDKTIICPECGTSFDRDEAERIALVRANAAAGRVRPVRFVGGPDDGFELVWFPDGARWASALRGPGRYVRDTDDAAELYYEDTEDRTPPEGT